MKIENLASMTGLDQDRHSPVQTSLRPKHSYCIQPYQFHKDHGLHFTEPISLTSTSSTQTLMNMGKIQSKSFLTHYKKMLWMMH